MATSSSYGFVKEGFWHKLPLGNREIYVPKGTICYIPRAVRNGVDLNVHTLVVKHPEKLESDSVVTKKDAINFGIIVPKENVVKMSVKEQREFSKTTEDLDRDFQ